jgi:hypothetical protein
MGQPTYEEWLAQVASHTPAAPAEIEAALGDEPYDMWEDGMSAEEYVEMAAEEYGPMWYLAQEM